MNPTTPARKAAEALNQAGKLHNWPAPEQKVIEAAFIIETIYATERQQVREAIKAALALLERRVHVASHSPVDLVKTQLRDLLDRMRE